MIEVPASLEDSKFQQQAQLEVNKRYESLSNRGELGLYLHEIGKIALLDAAEEVEVSKRIEAGLFAAHKLESNESITEQLQEELQWLADDGRNARVELIERNLKLVVSIAKRYQSSDVALLDLIQDGNRGLIRAVEKFDYTKGNKFSTHATWWIREAIIRGIYEQARVVRLPEDIVMQVNRVTKKQHELALELGREPRPAEVAARLDMTIDKVIQLETWGKKHSSLDTPINEDGSKTLGDIVVRDTSPSPETVVLNQEAFARLHAWVNALDPRSASIIRDHFGLVSGLPMTLAEAGKRQGVSNDNAKKIKSRALQQLRDTAAQELAS